MGAEATLDEFKKCIIRKRYLRCKQVCLIFHTIVSHVEYIEFLEAAHLGGFVSM